jgi:glycosyltransferase involved in cell wall biosynthesis
MTTKDSSDYQPIVRISTSVKAYGGNIYEKMVDEALIAAFDGAYQVHYNTFKRKGFYRLVEVPKYLWSNLKFARNYTTNKIRSFQTAFFNYTGRGVTIIYHIDSTGSPLAAKFFQDVLAVWFFKWIRRSATIVVISKFWQKFLEDKGFTNVKLIYCGFSLEDYIVSEEEVLDFKKRFGLSGQIVYIGNPQKKKGTDIVFEALKNSGYTLVSSGEGPLELPGVHKLKLSFREYVCLLKASSVVITYSQFLEGWNRVAHEAMLVGTPVIGTGTGGMREALEGGGQDICSNPAELPERVADAIRKREARAISGYQYASKFSAERFNQEWAELVRSIGCSSI